MAIRMNRMAEDRNPWRAQPSTLHPPITVPIVFVNGMLSGVRARGLPCDAYLADAGIEPQLLEQAGARVTADQYVALFGR